MMALYWTDSDAHTKPRRASFSFAFEDACTVAVIAVVWLYLFYGFTFY